MKNDNTCTKVTLVHIEYIEDKLKTNNLNLLSLYWYRSVMKFDLYIRRWRSDGQRFSRNNMSAPMDTWYKMLKTIVRLNNSCAVDNTSLCQCITRLRRFPYGITSSRQSSQVAEKDEKVVPAETKAQGQDVERIFVKRQKRQRNEPFVKNLFVGRFDKVILILL